MTPASRSLSERAPRGGVRLSFIIAFAVTAVFAAGLAASPPAHAALSKNERKCASKVGKASAKFADSVAKALSRCRANDISGKEVGACPSASATAAIDKAAAKLESQVAKSCGSTCSVTSGLRCLSDQLCPPNGALPEFCDSDGLGSRPFDMANLGYPGAFCEAAIGGEITVPLDLATCADALLQGGTSQLIDALYGSIVNASAVSDDAESCLSAAAKSGAKLASTIFKGVVKCRDAIAAGKLLADPADCRAEDPKLASKLAKAIAKLDKALDGKCTDAAVAELDFCGNGLGGTTTVDDAKACLASSLIEITDASDAPVLRTFAAPSLVEAAYPPEPVCGDDLVNQGPSASLELGEECDGDDDSACPGACAPPGDLFECTCTTTPRARLLVDGSIGAVDTDAGWTGLSHNQKLADNSGYLTTLENCDCSEFTGATCTGTSIDPVCDAVGKQLPVCSWDIGSSVRCDDRGDGDGAEEDSDCWICDGNASNSGDACATESDCDSQCFDAMGVAQGPCSAQADCAAGEECRGRCDKQQSCSITLDGGPLAVNTAGTAVCTIQLYREPVSGTRNIVTGEHALDYGLLSRVHLAEDNARPCPVCGGFCVGGENDLRVCKGRCSGSQDECRFDGDCPGMEVCEPETPDCPGGTCELSLVCGANADSNPGLTGTPCEITYEDPLYGTLSVDCLPFSGSNITGNGLVVDFGPSTDKAQTLPSTVPCTKAGFELLDCPCPDAAGAPTQPNSCAPACDAVGPDFGIGCATGNGAGAGTTCAAGVNAGALCDEDADCPGSTCSDNPLHCTGDPAFERFSCSTNADCGGGVCGDACPGGRCLPLCVPEPGDAEDGVCAAGPPVYRCSGELFQFITCSQAQADAGCEAVCSESATPCGSDSECPAGESCEGECFNRQVCEAGGDGILGNDDDQSGAGACVPDDRSCFLDPIPAEGGSTLNGKGDHTDWFTTGFQCFPETSSSTINEGAGFGGPGRVRRRGTTFVNVPSIP